MEKIKHRTWKAPKTYESFILIHGKKGDVFYTSKPERHMQAYCFSSNKRFRKIKTERMYIVNTSKKTIDKLVKVTLLSGKTK